MFSSLSVQLHQWGGGAAAGSCQAVPTAVDGGKQPLPAPAAAAADPAAHYLEILWFYLSRWAFLSRTKANTVAFTTSVI